MQIPPEVETVNIPAIPESLAEQITPWLNTSSVTWGDWQTEGVGIWLLDLWQGSRQLFACTGPQVHAVQLALPQPVTRVRSRPGRPEVLLALSDKGKEADQLWLCDFEKAPQPLTHSGRHLNPLWSPDGQHLAFSSTGLDPASHNLALLCPENGELRYLTTSGNWWPFAWSANGRWLVLQRVYSNSFSCPWVIDVQTGELTELYPVSAPVAGAAPEPDPALGQEVICTAAVWAAEDQGLYLAMDTNSEFRQLFYLAWLAWPASQQSPQPSSQLLPVPDQPGADLEQLAISACGHYLACSYNLEGQSCLQLRDLEHSPSGNLLQVPELPCGVIQGLHFHPRQPLLAAEISSATASSALLIMDLTAPENGWQDWSPRKAPLQPIATRLFHYRSFDQLQVPCFYFPQPTRSAAPVIIVLHGGPEEQSRPLLSNLQRYWYSALGCAILMPNYRGSTGYGRHYLDLDRGTQRENAVKDIGALLDWIAEQPELDSQRVCVFGGSYGGYLVLASLVHYSERLAAGIEMMGISDFVSYLENTSPYRQAGRRLKFGDERDPQMRAFLKQISPLQQAQRIHKPLFVLHGQHDPRVPVDQAERIVNSLQQQGVPVWMMLAHNEGHGLQQRANGEYFAAAASLFLERFVIRKPSPDCA